MPTSLRQQLDALASSFANGVLHAIRSASIEDLLAESGGSRRLPKSAVVASVAGGSRRRTGRLPRRSAEDVGQIIDRIVSLVKQSPKGMRAEEIRQKLDMQAKEMPRPLKEAVETGRLSKSGQKRATTYVARSGGASKPGRAADKASKASKARKGAKKAKAARKAKAGK